MKLAVFNQPVDYMHIQSADSFNCQSAQLANIYTLFTEVCTYWLTFMSQQKEAATILSLTYSTAISPLSNWASKLISPVI